MGGVGGVGWGGVKLILSNDTLRHAHSHPPSHNISNILDGKRKVTTTRICNLLGLWGLLSALNESRQYLRTLRSCFYIGEPNVCESILYEPM